MNSGPQYLTVVTSNQLLDDATNQGSQAITAAICDQAKLAVGMRATAHLVFVVPNLDPGTILWRAALAAHDAIAYSNASGYPPIVDRVVLTQFDVVQRSSVGRMAGNELVAGNPVAGAKEVRVSVVSPQFVQIYGTYALHTKVLQTFEPIDEDGRYEHPELWSVPDDLSVAFNYWTAHASQSCPIVQIVRVGRLPNGLQDRCVYKPALLG